MLRLISAAPVTAVRRKHRGHTGFRFSMILVNALNDEENDTFLLVENESIEAGRSVREYILLELPTKFLCKPDCKGLCPQCGKNLNEGKCSCSARQVDPRLEILKKLID